MITVLALLFLVAPQMTLILKHANKNRLGAIDWGQMISMYA